MAGQLRKTFHGLAIAQRQALVHAMHQLAQSLGHGLPRLLACRANFLDHGIGREEPLVVHVHNGGRHSGGLGLVGGLDEVGESYLVPQALDAHVLVQAPLADGLLVHHVGDAVQLAANGLDHPQPHDILQEAIAEVVATLVGKVFAEGRLGADGAAVLHAEQAPRTRGEEHRRQIAGGHGQIGAACVMGGRQHHARVVADGAGDLGAHGPQARAGVGDVAEQPARNVEGLHDRLVPCASLRIQKAGGGGIGVLDGLLPREQEVQVVGNHEERVGRNKLLGMLALKCQQLVDGVEGLALQAAAAVQLLGGHDGIGHLVHASRTGVAVGHGIAHQVVLGIQQHEVDAPGVDAHRFRGKARLLAEGKAPHQLARKQLHIPAVVAVPAHLAVVEAVHLFQTNEPVFHETHHHAARRGPDVHGRVAVAPQPLRTMRHVAIPIFARQQGHRRGRSPLTMSVFLNFYLGKRASH